MSNWLTRGIVLSAITLLVVWCPLAKGAAPTDQDLDKAQWKTYRIERTSAVDIRDRLHNFMPDDLRRVTFLSVDPQKNELTVMGPSAAIEMADRLIPRMQEIKTTLDYGTFPPIDTFARSPSREHSSWRGKVYRCAVRDIRAFEMELSRRFGNNPAVSFIFSDYIENQSLSVAVLAPEEMQAEFSKALQEMRVLLPEQQGRNDSQRDRPEITQYQYKPGDFDIVSRSYTPTRKSVELMARMDSVLREALRSRYTRISPPASGEKQISGLAVYEYVLEAAGQTRSVRVELNYDRCEISLRGDKRLCEQMLQLIEMIDRPKVPEGMKREIITIGEKQAHHVRQLAGVFAMQSSSSQVRPQVAAHGVARDAAPVPRFDQRAPATPLSINAPIQRVTYKPQQDLTGALGSGFDSGIGGPGDFGGGAFGYEQGPGNPNSSGFATVPPSLYIMPLPDIDIILFEGTPAEANKLREMIRDIEKLMAESQSKWEVVFLQHTDCLSMNEMLFDMTKYLLFIQKQGYHQIMPLRNPNALIVIGWGAQFDEVLELIEALDKPLAEPGSLWKVIPLKHISATYAADLIKDMFPIPQMLPSESYGRAWQPRLRWVVDDRTNSLIIHAGANDLREVEKFISKIDRSEGELQLQVQSFRIRNSLAADVQTRLTNILAPTTPSDVLYPNYVIGMLDKGERQILESGILSNFRVVADPQHNSLWVTAPEYAMPLIAKLIEMLDSPIPSAQIRIIPLTNGDANQVLTALNNLIPQQIRTGIQIGPQIPGARQAADFIPLRFVPDQRSNTIIAVGSKEDLDAVEAIIFQLDKDDSEKRITQVYTLKNAKAENVAAVLTSYIQAKRNIISQTPGGVSTFTQLEEALIVVAERERNSLLIEATPKYFEDIMKWIEDLDRQPDQVVIQVLIAEVSLTNSNEFGAELGLQDSILFNRSVNGAPGFNFNTPGPQPLGNNMNAPYSENVAPQLLSNFNMGRVGESGFGGLVFSASSESVSILIRALEDKRKLEVLSRPQIMAMDNQMAFILIGERVPFSSGSDTGYGSTTTRNTMEEVGLMLMVRPQISPDGKVVMDIGVEKSSVGATTDGVPLPDGSGGTYLAPKISAITTKTNVTASDNETVMLGGLLSKETLDVNRRVPFLSSIPVLGRLFQYKYDYTQKKELIIIMTPQIVRHNNKEMYSADAERIKREEAAKINWTLKEVTKMHGSPTGNNMRIWNPMADQPVSGGVNPLYPVAPVPFEDLEEMPAPPTRNRTSPVPMFE